MKLDRVWVRIKDREVTFCVPFLAYLKAVTGEAPFSGPYLVFFDDDDDDDPGDGGEPVKTGGTGEVAVPPVPCRAHQGVQPGAVAFVSSLTPRRYR